MRLSTSTNIVDIKSISQDNDIKKIKMLNDIGFKTLDISLMNFGRDDYLLKGDNWTKKVEQLAQYAKQIGVEFSQSHLPFIPSKDMEKVVSDDCQLSQYKEYIRRGYIANGILGVKWTVVHTINRKTDNYSIKDAAKFNYDFYAPFVELGKSNNVGTAFENMLRRTVSSRRRRFCEHYDELIDFVNLFNDKSVGICWDTGHANVMQLDQRIALKAVGSLLKATHINDNKGVDDDHMVPFMGTVDWSGVLDTLHEIGYQGDFTFEIPMMTSSMPLEIQTDMIKTCYEVGKYILK